MFIRQDKWQDWVVGGFGGSPSFVLNQSGQWLDYIPVMETQVYAWDTWGCTTFSTLNCLEILYKYQTGIEINWSDRFNLVKSGTLPNGGNSLQAVGDNIKAIGLPLESDCPEVSMSEYYTISKAIEDKAKLWLDKFEMNYWVVRPERETYQADIMERLKESPLAVCVAYANGATDEEILNPLTHQNHLVALVGYKEGSYWLVMDSYSRKIKRYSWDYHFGGIYRYKLTIKENDMLNVKENEIYHLVEGSEQKIAIGIDGNLFIGDKGQEFLVFLQAVGRKNCTLGGIKPIQVSLVDWNSVKHYNLKGERL